jgi:hypothetical protein
MARCEAEVLAEMPAGSTPAILRFRESPANFWVY